MFDEFEEDCLCLWGSGREERANLDTSGATVSAVESFLGNPA